MTPATATTLYTPPAPGRRPARKQAFSAWLKACTRLLCSLATCQVLAGPVTVAYTGTIQTFTIQTTGEYTLSAVGAQGAGSFQHANGGGLGAELFGDFFFTAGTVLNVVVGGAGNSLSAGGGGSFIYTLLDELLMAAGGGGGAGQSARNDGLGGAGLTGTSGGGGTGDTPSAGGISGSGGSGGQDWNRGGGGGGGWAGNGGNGTSGGGGGHGYPDFTGGTPGGGGFGGGGGAGFGPAGGGGGGYSGGGGGGSFGAGGGGGSYISSNALNAQAHAGVNTGNGFVSFELHTVQGGNDVPEPASWLLVASSLGALAWVRRRRV